MPPVEQGRTARRPAAVLPRAITRAMCLAASLGLALVACGPSPAPSPTTGGPIPTGPVPSLASGRPGTPGPPSLAPTPTADPFDPSAVTLRAESVARVDGRPLAFASLPDGSGRMYVASQDGRAWVFDGGRIEPTPLLDLRDRVLSGGERGLLGIAIHPRFPDDPRVFVDYTDLDGNTVVSSLEGNAAGTRLDPATERVLLRVAQPFANHNGGAVVFGPDGSLYVSLGDGGSGGDPQGNGQSRETLLGKILRLDVDAGGGGYGIPPDNPFAGGGGRAEIWLLGLRNPWRMSFDRETGDLWIGDVGQGAWEEVDVAPAGLGALNFGWNVMEGRHCFGADSCASEGLVQPVSEYDHSLGCTIIGGFVYRGSAFPVLRGGYLFADYCSGRIWGIPAAGEGFREPVELGHEGPGLAAFGEDANGELYLANLDGTISLLVARQR